MGAHRTSRLGRFNDLNLEGYAMAIGLSHVGSSVYSYTDRSRQLWVATQDGLVLFERSDSGSWREARRALRGEHISSIIFERQLSVGNIVKLSPRAGCTKCACPVR